MSAAHECDVCGALFKEELGVVNMEISVSDGSDGKCSSWSDIDLCTKCAKPLLKLLRPALQDLDERLGR